MTPPELPEELVRRREDPGAGRVRGSRESWAGASGAGRGGAGGAARCSKDGEAARARATDRCGEPPAGQEEQPVRAATGTSCTLLSFILI